MAAPADVGVAVVGGGMAGLAAAWALRDRDVVVLEAADRLGGRIRSERRGELWLNLGAHVWGSPESASGRLLEAVGVTAVPVPGTLTAVSLGGRLVARGPVETFPLRLPLSIASRVSLVRAGVRLRLAVRRYAAVAARRPGEEAAERQSRMLGFMDELSFSDFIGPLPEDVDLLFRATLTRSSGEPEELAAGYGVGYFHLVWNRGEGLSRNVLGGSGAVIDALAATLGTRVRPGARVTAVAADRDAVLIRYVQAGRDLELRARAAVVATPAYVTHELMPNLPDDTAAALAAIPYGPYVVGAFLTGESERMAWDGVYALATPSRSFSMLFNVANVVHARARVRRPGGSLMVYAAADLARRLDGLDDDSVADRFRADLHDLFPQTRGLVAETIVQRWPRGLPYPRVGRSRLQAALTRPLGRVHLAGDYLGTWYTETAVQTGLDAAAAVRPYL